VLAFDAAWMTATFERYGEYARHVIEWTNALLLPPPPHVLRILGVAAGILPWPDGSRTDSRIRRTFNTGSWIGHAGRNTWQRSGSRLSTLSPEDDSGYGSYVA